MHDEDSQAQTEQPAEQIGSLFESNANRSDSPATPPGEKRRRRGRKLPVWLLEHEVQALLEAADAEVERARAPSRQAAARRNRLMILVALYTGVRVSELVGLRAEHLDLDGGQALIYQGKGSKDRYVPVDNVLVTELRAWLNGRRAGYVFPSPAGTMLTTRAVQKMTRRLAIRAKLIKKLTPHKLRHSFASRLIQRGVDIATVRDILGHASIQTTQVYLHADASRFKSAVGGLWSKKQEG
jgi:integrase/recombinase XerD